MSVSDPVKEVQVMGRINRYLDRQLEELDTNAARRVLTWFKNVVADKEITNSDPATSAQDAQTTLAPN